MLSEFFLNFPRSNSRFKNRFYKCRYKIFFLVEKYNSREEQIRVKSLCREYIILYLTFSFDFFPFPYRRKVRITLTTIVGRWRQWHFRLFRQEIDNMFQTYQINEFRVAWIRYEMHLWRWWFWWGNLQRWTNDLILKAPSICEV